MLEKTCNHVYRFPETYTWIKMFYAYREAFIANTLAINCKFLWKQSTSHQYAASLHCCSLYIQLYHMIGLTHSTGKST